MGNYKKVPEGQGWMKCSRCKKKKKLHLFRLYRSDASKYCRSCVKKVQDKWKSDNPYRVREICRKSRLKTDYGMTQEQFELMKKNQDNKCKICGITPEAANILDLYVDHCHKSNKVRGLLCRKCNMAIGFFMDSPTILSAAMEYLKEHEEI